MKHLTVLLALLLACQTAPAWAYRPFDSTTADVEEAGELEFQVGPMYFQTDGTDKALVTPNLEIELGVAPGWEVGIEARHQLLLATSTSAARSSVEGTELFFKSVLRDGSLQSRPGVSLATKFSVLLPEINGDAGPGLEWKALVSQRWEPVTLHFNSIVELTRSHNFVLGGGLILEGPYAWSVRPVSEFVVEHEFGSGAEVSALLGAIWTVHEDLLFDVAVRQTWVAGKTEQQLRAGVTWAWPLW